MKKKYTMPFTRTVDLVEEGLIAMSDGQKMNLNDQHEVSNQMTQEKNLWGREGIWK